MSDEVRRVIEALKSGAIPENVRGEVVSHLAKGLLGCDARFEELIQGLASSDGEIPEGFLDAVMTKFLDGFEVTLDQMQQRTLDQQPLVDGRLVRPPSRQESRDELAECQFLPAAQAVYGDWNLFDDIAKGRLPRLRTYLIERRNRGLQLPFSAEHVLEASNIGDEVPDKQFYLERNLQVLSELTNDSYWYLGIDTHGKIKPLVEPPAEVLENLRQTEPWATRAFDLFVGFGSQPLGKHLRKGMGFDSSVLGLYQPEEVIAEIERALGILRGILNQRSTLKDPTAAVPLPATISQWLSSSRAHYPNGQAFNEGHDFAALFVLLDLFGFKSEGINKARSAFRDGQHAYSASFADVFLTHDKRLRLKSRCAFSYFGKATRVIDTYDAETWLEKQAGVATNSG